MAFARTRSEQSLHRLPPPERHRRLPARAGRDRARRLRVLQEEGLTGCQLGWKSGREEEQSTSVASRRKLSNATFAS